jgi:type I restriction enzyme S subunit
MIGMQNVPQLRFQEFDGAWIVKNLEEITNWASGGTPPKDNPLFWDGDIPWISASSMRGMVYSDSEFKITNAGLKKGSKLVKKGSLLILVRGSMLFNKIPIGIVSKDVAFNQDVKSIVVDVNFSTSEFILNWFIAFEPKILNMVTGTGIGAGKLDLPDLKALKISLPTLPEQQKIASFLSAVDEKIKQLSRKKELLEQYKKGVMQQLFSGKLRFKDENGNDYPVWEEKKLGEVARITTGSSNRQDSNLDGEYTFFDRSQDIRSSNIFLFDTEAIIVPGEGQDFIPKHFIGKFDLHQRTYAVMDFGINMGKFLFYYISYHSNHLNSHAVGSTVKSLRLPMFEKMPIRLPSIPEQQKIANFLSSNDTKIESVNQQLAQTQTFKKGLLQQMFV